MEKYNNKINEIKNSHNTIVIPDLHGNFKAYKNILIKSGVVNKNLNWIGGNTHIVFLGDIIFDRHINGIQILQDIQILRKQAKTQSGDISIIAGNHEEMGINFLSNKKVNVNILQNIKINLQSRGGYEFINMFGRESGFTLLEKIQSTKNGLEILKNISELKVIENVGNSLLMHTDTTSKMVELLLNYGINYINNEYKKEVRRILLETKEPINEKINIFETFLNTSNRGNDFNNKHNYFGEKEGKLLKKAGYDNIFHGHTYHGLEVQNIGGINVIPLDMSYGKGLTLIEGTETYSIIDKNGEIKIVTQGSKEGGSDISEYYN